MFERRHKNRVQLIRSTSGSSLNSQGSTTKRAVASALTRQGHERSHHERVKMLASAGGARSRLNSDYSTDNDDGSVGGSSMGELSIGPYHNAMPGNNNNHGEGTGSTSSKSSSSWKRYLAHGSVIAIAFYALFN